MFKEFQVRLARAQHRAAGERRRRARGARVRARALRDRALRPLEPGTARAGPAGPPSGRQRVPAAVLGGHDRRGTRHLGGCRPDRARHAHRRRAGRVHELPVPAPAAAVHHRLRRDRRSRAPVRAPSGSSRSSTLPRTWSSKPNAVDARAPRRARASSATCTCATRAPSARRSPASTSRSSRTRPSRSWARPARARPRSSTSSRASTTSTQGAVLDRRPRRPRRDAVVPAEPDRLRHAGLRALLGIGARQHRLRTTRRDRCRDRGGRACGAGARLHHASCPTATTRASASAASSSRADSASASRSPARCSSTRGSSIMDDSTSSVDSETEAAIRDAARHADGGTHDLRRRPAPLHGPPGGPRRGDRRGPHRRHRARTRSCSSAAACTPRSPRANSSATRTSSSPTAASCASTSTGHAARCASRPGR